MKLPKAKLKNLALACILAFIFGTLLLMGKKL